MQQLPQLSGEDNQRGQNLSAAGAAHQPNRQRRHNHQQQQHQRRLLRGGAAASAGGDLGGTRILGGGGGRSRSNRTWGTAKGHDGRLELVVLAAVPADGMGVRADCLRTKMIHCYSMTTT